MFILAHQFLGVSSKNNYPAEFAQASRVQSVKHLVCKCHHTTERRLGYSSRQIGLKETSALPQHTVPHPRERISGPAGQNKSKGIAVLRTCRTCLPTLANTAQARPPDSSGTPHSSHRVLGFCSKFTAERFATYD